MPPSSRHAPSLRSFVDTALRCPPGFEFADRLHFKPFQRLRARDWLNRFGLEDWEAVTQDLSDHDLRRVLEVMVLAERDFRWSGGSAASGIWLFTLLCKRDASRREEILDWCFRHRGDNPWLPLGTSIPNAKSWAEAQQVMAYARQRAAKRRAEGEAKEDAYRAVGRARRRAAAEHRSRTASRNDRRKDLVAGLAGLSLLDRIEAFLSWPLPRDSFRHAMLSQVGDDYKLVPRETLRKLQAAIGNRRGAWRQISAAIEVVLKTA